MIDTHCHLTYDGLHERLDAVVAGAKAAGVDRMITIGTTPADAEKSREIAERHANVFFAAGLHPHYSTQWDETATRASIVRLSSHPKCVAIGEMGLDRHYPEPKVEHQKKMFAVQLEVIRELDEAKPQALKAVVIHNREATDETVGMIRDSRIAGNRFVFHCFTGTGEELDKILDLGAMVSFTGIVTFKSAAEIAKCAARVPDDRIMIETDSPYLTPEPNRKLRPNEPKYVADVARFLAKLRGMDERAFVEMVDGNAGRFFGLK